MNYNTEVWKDVVGYEEYYQVSNEGRVRSLDRYTNNGNGCFVRKGRVLKQGVNRTGYNFVMLTNANGEAKNCKVHRLVAITFIENPFNKKTVNHKDGNKTNNHIDNLEWATYSENMQHAIDTGLKPKYLNGQEGKKVAKLTLENDIVEIYNSLKEAAERNSINSKTISKVCTGYKNYKTAHGFKWKYIEV
ncbi:NUMOD4 domain-containing protein [Staphylococcus pseudintermedius]|uniref:NUMOD4 domain-containing protein n=1 Tax=Staphylococcus pseudintermedius TaxID=283734 RepID=UPI0019FCFDE0|nr:NUMOD4 motif-containing HNH endonuclease [Staphylococcus pseudintermedius]HEC2213454.1 NUMOD4 motif-containing HNH endonuclease [Staphylococcus delphini]EMC0260235.1 NUMOD4 motif-containing HNH endonuclease [Staphylococcus pseudintermedius]HAR5878534.1 endonuclease [Staphylococcus pseudintermedius]HAR5922044.1 endonuclease [Staphylococcus pseudintermedius]